MILRILLYLMLLSGLLTFAFGCDRQSQYSILTTVFTGVPPMEELYGETLPEETIRDSPLAEESMEILYQHPLWAARQCRLCHVADVGGEVSRVEAGDTEQPQEPSSQEVVAALVLPANKLCINCHLDKTARRAIRERLWLHNPVARGDCLSCHSEHQSPNHAHLRQPLQNICASCHETDQLPIECVGGMVVNDKKTNACLGCHNTHMGGNRFLLIRDYTEIKIVAGHVPEPASPSIAPAGQSE